MHAQLLIASSVDLSSLPEELKTSSIDVLHIAGETFGIGEARALIDAASTRPVAGTTRSFVVHAQSMTLEAQNALLKLFEEPPQDTAFYLIVPHESMVIGTLRSRLHSVDSSLEPRSSVAATEFLNASYADRLALIADLQKKGESTLMVGLATELAALAADGRFSPEVMRELSFVERHIRIQGGSKKMLLEHAALVLPVGV